MWASGETRSGSLSLAASLARFQRPPQLCRQRRTVSADTWRPRRASQLKAKGAPLPRTRYQAKADGGWVSRASKLRCSQGARLRAEPFSSHSSLCQGRPPWRPQAATSYTAEREHRSPWELSVGEQCRASSTSIGRRSNAHSRRKRRICSRTGACSAARSATTIGEGTVIFLFILGRLALSGVEVCRRHSALSLRPPLWFDLVL
jgi:hypothetical protein